MADTSRIEDLRRRVRDDPASIAFAQLAEELRRAGQYRESVDVCNAGLAVHPGYLSARVTLGRALIALDQLDAAEQQLERVRQSAPEHIAAIRALADIHHRRGLVADSRIESGTPPAPTHPDADSDQSVAPEPFTRADPGAGRIDEGDYVRVVRTLTVLDQWLDAIHVARANRRA